MESPVRPPTESDFRLIETFAFRPGQGFVRLSRHLQRMARTAAWLGISFDPTRVDHVLSNVTSNRPLRCRLTLDLDGTPSVTTAPLADNPVRWVIGFAQEVLESSDVWLRHKTTRREVYDRARATLPIGIDELVFANERNELCEGTITNLFVETDDDRLLTPPLSAGLLPGILREELMDSGRAVEAVLTPDHMKSARQIFMGNSLRGLIPAKLAQP